MDRLPLFEYTKIGANLYILSDKMLLMLQPVVEYGFTLYFLAFTEEEPPNADLESVSLFFCLCLSLHLPIYISLSLSLYIYI